MTSALTSRLPPTMGRANKKRNPPRAEIHQKPHRVAHRTASPVRRFQENMLGLKWARKRSRGRSSVQKTGVCQDWRDSHPHADRGTKSQPQVPIGTQVSTPIALAVARPKGLEPSTTGSTDRSAPPRTTMRTGEWHRCASKNILAKIALDTLAALITLEGGTKYWCDLLDCRRPTHGPQPRPRHSRPAGSPHTWDGTRLTSPEPVRGASSNPGGAAADLFCEASR